MKEVQPMIHVSSQGYAESESSQHSDGGLESLRLRLDGIDEKLLDALRERIACCSQIAFYKREHTVPMMQPHRIAVVQERAARYARKHGLSAPFLHQVYELLIAETCRVEELIINEPAGRGEPALAGQP